MKSIRFAYTIISIAYNGPSRVTTACIRNDFTGEIFFGTAKRREEDELDMSIGSSLALVRALRKMTNDALDDRARDVIEGDTMI